MEVVLLAQYSIAGGKSYETRPETGCYKVLHDNCESSRGASSKTSCFLEALQTLPKFEILYGHFLATPVTCRNCGHTYETHHEKMTDVNIAVELMTDAFQDKFDTALLISADSDLVGPVRAMRRLFNNKKVIVAFPPARSSVALQRTAHGFYFIGRDKLSKSVFPDEVTKPDGFTIRRPAEWR